MRTSRPKVGEGLRRTNWARRLSQDRRGEVGAHWIALILGVVLALVGFLWVLVGGGIVNLAGLYTLIIGVALVIVGVVADVEVSHGRRGR
ncbi:MAG TPA: hypothetical protein VGV89_01595 [Thermoplasmata archaeon]|nr:hypothetical protein [Thermoplasmata archaeon]